jgi:hypothetical protein
MDIERNGRLGRTHTQRLACSTIGAGDGWRLSALGRGVDGG